MAKQSPPAWVKKLVSTLNGGKFIASSALLLAFCFAGCADNMPTSPLESPSGNLNTNSLPDLIGKFGASTEWTVQQTMRKQGGTMELDGQRLQCTFEAGALPVNSALITAQMKLNGPQGSATRLDLDFQPSMTFKKDVLLKIDATYLSGTSSKYVLWYFDPAVRKWVKQDERNIESTGLTTFKLNHYSAYALTR